jgi:cell division protease FtsH
MPEQTGTPPNPRGRRNGDRRLTPRTPRGSAMWYAVGLLVLLAIGQLFFYSIQSGEILSYSDFKKAVRDHQVVEVTVGEEQVRGTLKSTGPKPRRFTVIRIEDPKLVDDLEANGVAFKGEVANRWMSEVVGWIIPLIVLVALWSFFFRRMGGAEGGVMSFARSRAKI